MVESDEEQLEVLKNWWDENGTSLVVTIVLALGGTFGYQAWQNNVRESGEAASALYETLSEAVENVAADTSGTMITTAESVAADLKEKHTDTSYAVFASLQMAKLAVNAGDLSKAETQLKWALDHNSDEQLETIIRVRLARVYVALEDATAAMAQLVNHQPAPAVLSTFEEARGDVFHAMGDHENARQAYQLAIKNLEDEATRPVLELKLADIPLTSSAPNTADADSETDQEAGDA